VVPLAIVSALEPVRKLEPRQGIRELFLREPANWPPLRCPGLAKTAGALRWDRFFRKVNDVLKGLQRRGKMPFRQRAIRAARDWMLARFKQSDGLGAIFPPIVFSLVALKALGYDDESPEMKYCYKQLDDLVIDDEAAGTARLQPCKSPVWDTAIAFRAIAAAGAKPDRPAIRRAVAWLLDRQTTSPGDWSATVDAEPGGWYFEYSNEFYPDVDDTAMVLMALQTQFEGRDSAALSPEFDLVAEDGDDATQDRGDDSLQRCMASIQRGLRWMMAMQNKDGGWGAFDRDNNREFLCYVPFADHNAMIDPSTPDLSGRVLEALGKLGGRIGDPVIDRCVAYIRGSQEADGSWFGRWGVNYIYGTWQTLVGLAAVGVPQDDPAVVAGVNWLLTHQQPSGAWGESADTYEFPQLRGQGNPTASQTAWAVWGLVAAGLAEHPATIRGIRYLINTQNDNGTWDETEFTGTGFPRVFYLRYHYYPIYFPLLALAQWSIAAERKKTAN
jgi:squalene-hopene/tetraprenyl-beta-curcumene cyclase